MHFGLSQQGRFKKFYAIFSVSSGTYLENFVADFGR